jgi:uncharacterized membrane protein
MRDLLLFGLVGALSGSRSMLGPAMVADRALPMVLRPAVGLLAVGEMAADKHPRVPDRTAPGPLAGRLVTGALTAAAIAAPGRGLRAAAAGAVGAVWGTYALYHLRRLATTRFGVSNAVAGLAEDALAVAAAAALLHGRRWALAPEHGRTRHRI